jgi:hypothetical protein
MPAGWDPIMVCGAMSQLKDYYTILGVPIWADAAAIERAYKQGSFRWHPDRNPDRPDEAHRRFLDLSEAAAILGDPVSRRNYDRRWKQAFGSRPRPATGAGAPPPAGGREGRLSVEELIRQTGIEEAARSGGAAGDARFEAQVQAVLNELGLRRGAGGPGAFVRLLVTLATFLVFAASAMLGLTLVASTAWPEAVVWFLAALPAAAMFAVLVRTWIQAWRARVAGEHDRKLAERIVRRYRDR